MGYLYGHFVGFMKVLLPTVATALLLIVVIWPQLNEQNKTFEIGFKEIDKSAAENLRMEKARFFHPQILGRTLIDLLKTDLEGFILLV